MGKEEKNKIIVITAPSGAGKTSITTHLLQTFPQLAFSVSAATRPPRENEKNGVEYYFVSREEFNQKILDKAFIEWEMVYEGKYYGTLKSELHRVWNNKQVPVLDIDVKGAIHVQQQYPINILTIFIEPPSIEELKRRLKIRGTETDESLQARINKAAYEISFKTQFGHTIMNDNLTNARQQTEKIVGDFLKN